MHTGKQKQMNVSYQASLVNRHIRRFTGTYSVSRIFRVIKRMWAFTRWAGQARAPGRPSQLWGVHSLMRFYFDDLFCFVAPFSLRKAPQRVPKYLFFSIKAHILFYKFSSNVCLGGFAGSEPSLSNKHNLLCWPSPHHPIAQFQCYGRILSERLTCPVDWTRSPPPTHALWPLCGSCHKHARHYA